MSNEKNITSNDITSYCLGNCDKWEENYTKYLEWLSQEKLDLENMCLNPYRDPDGKRAKAWEYYQNLTAFLNAQEDFYQKQLKGKWTYEFQTDNETYGIAVYGEGKNELLFYLKSDQFGFSAPNEKKNHIYDVYLEKTADNDKGIAINNIVKWILQTRTLGGGLLWPMEQNKGKWIANPQINTMRGGTKTYKSEYYIEDRIDLTLWEIKHYLDFNPEKKGQKYCEEYKRCYKSDEKTWEGDILCGCMTMDCQESDCCPCDCMKKCPTNLKKWLDHFQDFKTYVEFFCFQDFCTETENTYIPYNMILVNQEKNKKNSIYNVTDERFCENTEKMLNTLCEKIETRTSAMNNAINRTRKENI